MIRLTKAEEQIMIVLWKKDKAFVKEILAELPEPKPAYNTVSTVVRVLEQKGFVGHESFGRTHRYFPAIDQNDYTTSELDKMMKDHFGGSAKKMISAFVENKSIDLSELDELLKLIKKTNK